MTKNAISRDLQEAQFAILLDSFMNATYKNYGSHSFAAGYFGSTVKELFGLLPQRTQRDYINRLVQTTSDQIKKGLEADQERSKNVAFTPA